MTMVSNQSLLPNAMNNNNNNTPTHTVYYHVCTHVHVHVLLTRSIMYYN